MSHSVMSPALATSDVVKELDNQTLQAEHRARKLAEAARNEAEHARDMAVEGQQEATHRLKREARARAEIAEQRDALTAEVDSLRRRLKQESERAHQAENDKQVALEERTNAQQHQEIADAAREGALQAKKKACQDLDKERSAKEALKADLTRVQQQLGELQDKHEAECKARLAAQESADALLKQLTAAEEAGAAAAVQVDHLSTRVDRLKQALADTERKLAKSEEQYAAAAAEASLAKDTTRKALEDCDLTLGKAGGRRQMADLEVQEALKEVARAEHAQQLAELAADDAARALELEIKLRVQSEAERDRVAQMLRDEQHAATQRDRQLAEAAEELEDTRAQLSAARAAERDAADTAEAVASHVGVRQEVLEELQARLREAEGGRRVAEDAWREAEDARRDALDARREADRNWHQLSALLERAEGARKGALAALLQERAARLMAQQLLEAADAGVTRAAGGAAPGASSALATPARRALLHEMRSEQRALSYIQGALADAAASQGALQAALEGGPTRLDALRSLLSAPRLDAAPPAMDEDVGAALAALEAAAEAASAAGAAAAADVRRAADTAAQAQAHTESTRLALRSSGDLLSDESSFAGCDLDHVVPGLLNEMIDLNDDVLLGEAAGVTAGKYFLGGRSAASLAFEDVTNALTPRKALRKGPAKGSDVSASCSDDDDDSLFGGPDENVNGLFAGAA